MPGLVETVQEFRNAGVGARLGRSGGSQGIIGFKEFMGCCRLVWADYSGLVVNCFFQGDGH